MNKSLLEEILEEIKDDIQNRENMTLKDYIKLLESEIEEIEENNPNLSTNYRIL